MLKAPPYIGDAAFRDFLDEHECPTLLEEIRMRFLGTMVSPTREDDIYPQLEDFFEYHMPEFAPGPESGHFLGTFQGLWNSVSEESQDGPISLSRAGTVSTDGEIKDLLFRRIEEVRFGFLDGIWGDDEALPLPAATSAMLTALEQSAGAYETLLAEIVRNDARCAGMSVAELLGEISEVDQAVEEGIAGLVAAFRENPSTDHPMMTRATILMQDLAYSEGLPRAAIGQCIARRDEMVPLFLATLRDHVAGRPADGDRETALFLIIHILGELGEQGGFAPLMDLLEGDPEQVESILGDAITENLTGILISVFDGDTRRLYRLMENPDVDAFVRAAAFEAWTYFVAAGRIDRHEAEAYLSSCLKSLRPREEGYVWIAWAEAIARLGFAALAGKVRAAFDLGRIDPTSFLPEEFEDILDTSSRADDLLALPECRRLRPFSDTIGVLSRWYGFSEEYLRETREAERAEWQGLQLTDPVTNPFRKIGRNDPCPCGSGKKFKKCCLQ